MRRGDVCSGFWEVKVERAGRYELALYRWPPEAGHGLGAGINGADVGFRRDAIAPSDWWLYQGGAALAVETARVEIDGQTEAISVDGAEQAARISVALRAGEAQLRAWFTGADGLMQSPYYVEVRRID